MSGGLQGFFGQIHHPLRSPEVLKLAMPVAGILDAWRTGVFHISKDSFTQLFSCCLIQPLIMSLLLGESGFRGRVQSLP